jgi:formate hydrogenlyase transcriptional activator
MMRGLLAYPWPGNVRELENVLERAVILAADKVLDFGLDLTPALGAGLPTPQIDSRSLETVQRDHVLNILGQTGWVIEGPGVAARILGLHPNTLRHRMKKLGLIRASQRPSHQMS